MKKRLTSVFLFIHGVFLLTSQTNLQQVNLQDEYLLGLDLFAQENYYLAIDMLQKVLRDPYSKDLHGDAQYWISLSYLEMGELGLATRSFEDFLAANPYHPRHIEGRYHRGRILYLQGEYDNAINYYSSFVQAYPMSPLVGDALFWVGESLYQLGRYADAKVSYKRVVSDYRRSSKFEAATYRLSLLEYKEREEELIKFLRWSHEEYLRNSANYDQRAREFEDALEFYRQKALEMVRIRDLYENRFQFLESKERALNLKEEILSDVERGKLFLELDDIEKLEGQAEPEDLKEGSSP